MAEIQLFLTIFENRFINNSGLDGTVASSVPLYSWVFIHIDCSALCMLSNLVWVGRQRTLGPVYVIYREGIKIKDVHINPPPSQCYLDRPVSFDFTDIL